MYSARPDDGGAAVVRGAPAARPSGGVCSLKCCQLDSPARGYSPGRPAEGNTRGAGHEFLSYLRDPTVRPQDGRVKQSCLATD